MMAIPAEVEQLAQERLAARADKDYARSDELRDEIKALGFLVKDTADGYELTEAPPFDQFQNVSQLRQGHQNSVSASTAIILVIDGWPEDVRTCLSALTAYMPADAAVVAIDCGNVESVGIVLEEMAQRDERVHVFHVAQMLAESGWAGAVQCGIDLADSRFIGVMDVSTIWEGDALTPMLTVFDNPAVALTGWRGVNVNVEDEWRSFTDASAGSVDAVLGYFMLMRTSVARDIGPNSKARFYRNADMEWSLAIRSAGHDAVIPAIELPLRQDRHHGYHDSEPEYRDQQSKKTYDRLLKTYRGKNNILHSKDSNGD